MGRVVQGIVLVLAVSLTRGKASGELRGPVFINEPPNSITFANDEGAMLNCSAHGSPAPEMDWIGKDGEPIDNVEGYLQIFPNNSLYFPKFTGNLQTHIHHTSYRCVARNSAGTIISREVKVKAVMSNSHKSYNVLINDQWVMEGNTAVLTCQVDPAYIRPYVIVTTWIQGSTTIRHGGRFSIFPTSLQIRDVRERDGYFRYRCVVYNQLTKTQKASQLATIHVIATANVVPNVEQSLDDVTVTEGETIHLPCVASGFPYPSYLWKKDGQTVMTQTRIRYVQGNLEIGNAGISDSGVYKCSISNPIGSKTITTVVTVRKHLRAYITPASQTVDAEGFAVLNCTVSGHPVERIEWYKNGKQLVETSRVFLETPTSLQIHDVMRQDKGMYQCMVSNDVENVQGTAQLSLGAAKPVFTERFSNKYVKPGPPQSLKCVAYGNPTPTISWKLDGSVMLPNPRFRVGDFLTELGDVVSYVNITDLRVEDGGRYECVASNHVGTLSHMATLHVYGVPYIRPMPNVTAVASHPLAIRCSVSGYPVTSITWKKDDTVLRTDHRVTVKSDGELTILSVQRSHDEGMYRCNARNDNREGMSRDIYIHVMEPPVITPFRFSPQLKQGQRVSVACVVTSGDLPITISWLKDGQPLPPDMGFQTRKIDAYSSTLSTEDAVPRQNGNYTCVASNTAATANYTATMHVDVPPRWVSPPQDSFVVLGHKVMLHCQTAGTPDPVVTWKKSQGAEPGNYRPMDFRSDSRLRQFPNGSLQIENARESDDSSYLCHSDNGIGTISRAIFLTVHIPASFKTQQANYSVVKGQNISVECRAVGDTPMQISWRYNSAPLLQTPRYQRSEFNFDKGYGSRLRIALSERSDTGYYLCTAKNNFGHDQMLVHLVVQESPDQPANLAVEQSKSRTIVVSWTMPFNGHSEITDYIIQYKNSTDVWQGVIQSVTIRVQDGGHTQGAVSGLHPARAYDLRLLAKNKIGVSEPSLPVSVSTGEEAPSGPPLNIKVNAENSQVLKVTWSPPSVDHCNGIITGYYIHYKVHNSSSPWRHSTLSVGEVVKLEMVLDNLKKFTRYSVQLQAYNAKGTGPQSDIVNVFTLEDVPSLPPTSVAATALSSQSIMVVWSPPPVYTLNGILQGYKVIVKPVRDDEDESDSHIQTSTTMQVGVYNLQKYTNYSVQVLAFTRKGEGVRSAPLYVMTEQDVPGSPSDVKSFATNSTAVLVTWLPPDHPNGVLKGYIVYQLSEDTADPIKHTVNPTITRLYVSGLSTNQIYSFQVTASTVIGEGDRTRVVKSSPLNQISARIATFPHKILIQWKNDVILPCDSIGDVPLKVTWSKRQLRNVQEITPSDNIRLLSNGSLQMLNVQSADAADYVCRVSNDHGTDEIIITLIVQVNRESVFPPNPPKLSVAVTTSSTIQVNWRSGSNGGSAITGFTMFYKEEYHQAWTPVSLGPNNRTYTATRLSCGTRYKFKMNARNFEGPSIYSETIKAKTNGSTPISPAQSLILTDINSTYVTLTLATWQTGGCPITRYAIKYQVFGDSGWTTVSNDIKPHYKTFTVPDLHPATWYVMKVSAENQAGQTDIQLKFATLTYEGSTIQPIHLVGTKEPPFYEQIYVIVPLCAGFIIVICTSLAVILYCKRRQEELKNKEVTYNLRRDITAETSLMNDLDKRVITDFEDDTNPESIRNVNLLIQLDPTDGDMPDGTVPPWGFNSSNSENSFHAVCYGDDITPYATFHFTNRFTSADDNADNENRTNSTTSPPLTTFHTSALHQSDDSLVAQKQQARQKMMTFKVSDFPPPPAELLAEGSTCQTNLAFHPSAPRRVRFKDVPESCSDTEVISHAPKRWPGLECLVLSDCSVSSSDCETKSKKSTWQEGVILSPSKYASAEHIHSIFYGGVRLPTPSSLSFIPKSRHGSRPGSSAERGSHRASTLSSITTVSSSREELLQAYENARYNPNPAAEFTEKPPNSSSTSHTSQPTDCSESTEPGIRQFTQAPPRPEECRQSSCEVPMYEGLATDSVTKRPSNIKLSVNSAAPAPPQRRKSPHRRTRGRAKPRIRGAVLGRKVIRAPRQPVRAYSRGSTVSTNSEDIYGVNEQTYESPSEGYVSHQHDSYVCTDSEYDPYSYRPRSRSKYLQTTPYPSTGDSPETPGCDERKPLVSALARTALASPNEEEETSLLERYYHPVMDNASLNSSGDMVLTLSDCTDGHYTDNYTVV